MDFSSLRSYPAPRRAWPGFRIPPAAGLTPRKARVLFDLAALAGVAAALYGAWWAADKVGDGRVAEPKPLDFAVVAKRNAKVRLWTSRDDVEQLLGPPTRQLGREDPRFDELEALAEWEAFRNRAFRNLIIGVCGRTDRTKAGGWRSTSRGGRFTSKPARGSRADSDGRDAASPRPVSAGRRPPPGHSATARRSEFFLTANLVAIHPASGYPPCLILAASQGTRPGA